MNYTWHKILPYLKVKEILREFNKEGFYKKEDEWYLVYLNDPTDHSYQVYYFEFDPRQTLVKIVSFALDYYPTT